MVAVMVMVVVVGVTVSMPHHLYIPPFDSNANCLHSLDSIQKPFSLSLSHLFFYKKFIEWLTISLTRKNILNLYIFQNDDDNDDLKKYGKEIGWRGI